MKRIFRTCSFLTVCFCLCLFAAPVQAYIVNAFNAKDLLNAADVVCYGRVVSVKSHPVSPDTSFSPPLTTEGAVATVSVISTIKGEAIIGNAPLDIEVVFRRLTPFVFYTQLVQNESAILFLKSEEGHFRFVDDLNGKLAVPVHKPLYYRSKSPMDRMVAELIFASRVDKGQIRLVCIEQLGSFDMPGVVTYLRTLTTIRDMAVQGVTYASLIRLNRPPAATRLAAFFKRQDDIQSLKRFRTTGYSNGHLKAHILDQMEGVFNVLCQHFVPRYFVDSVPQYAALSRTAQTAAQRWKTFDLIGFLRVAIQNIPPDREDNGMHMVSYRSIAGMIGWQIDWQGRPAYLNHTFRKGSRPIVVRLVNHANLEVSEAAAIAIDRMIVEKHNFPYPQGGSQDTIRYIRACREWLKKHPRWVKSDK
jgi:hypothetical protein